MSGAGKSGKGDEAASPRLRAAAPVELEDARARRKAARDRRNAAREKSALAVETEAAAAAEAEVVKAESEVVKAKAMVAEAKAVEEVMEEKRYSREDRQKADVAKVITIVRHALSYASLESRDTKALRREIRNYVRNQGDKEIDHKKIATAAFMSVDPERDSDRKSLKYNLVVVTELTETRDRSNKHFPRFDYANEFVEIAAKYMKKRAESKVAAKYKEIEKTIKDKRIIVERLRRFSAKNKNNIEIQEAVKRLVVKIGTERKKSSIKKKEERSQRHYSSRRKVNSRLREREAEEDSPRLLPPKRKKLRAGSRKTPGLGPALRAHDDETLSAGGLVGGGLEAIPEDREHTPEAAKADAAAKIQATARGRAARKELSGQHEAAVKIQAVVRGRAARKEPAKIAVTPVVTTPETTAVITPEAPVVTTPEASVAKPPKLTKMMARLIKGSKKVVKAARCALPFAKRRGRDGGVER